MFNIILHSTWTEEVLARFQTLAETREEFNSLLSDWETHSSDIALEIADDELGVERIAFHEFT